MFKRALIVVAMIACASFATRVAGAEEHQAPAAADAVRPAVGAWVGDVSWNDPPVSYAWEIYPDGTFSSGRDGRGLNGGGRWGGAGAHLILKYDDGFRYEGEIVGDAFSGDAYRADGRVFGQFSMWRAGKGAVEESP